MADKKIDHKTYLHEVKVLRKHIQALEKEKEYLFKIEKKKATIQHALRERVKKLNCLFGLSHLIEQNEHSIEAILQGVVNIIPKFWQYPNITCARIVFKTEEYLSSHFKVTFWGQAAPIRISGNLTGAIEVYYLKQKPRLFEGPFLKEERLLLNAIAERIGKACTRIQAVQQIKRERNNLKKLNITLREVLSQVHKEKIEWSKQIQTNIDKVILPMLITLENQLSSDQMEYINILKNHLMDIVSPFIYNLSNSFANLTPVEIQICNLIKNGYSTKEIAKLRGVSPDTVSRHRENIRKKLNINDKKINLMSHLNSLKSSENKRRILPPFSLEGLSFDK